jgi:hypothetical protein
VQARYAQTINQRRATAIKTGKNNMCQNTNIIQSSSTSIEQLIEGKTASDFSFWNGSRQVSATRYGGFSSRTGEWSEDSRADESPYEAELVRACIARDNRLDAERREQQAIQDRLEVEKLVSDIAAITNLKLKKIAEKYNAIEYDADNYSIGGGLDSDKFASRRHEAARNDAGKATQGEVAAMFKKATGCDVSTINEVIDNTFYDLEWHHAGKLPKRYGGGMKKTYFLNNQQIVKLAIGWDAYLEKLATDKAKEAGRVAVAKELQARKDAFLKENAVRFTRQENRPEHSITDCSECNGKYGWFNADKNIYRLTEYHTGWAFATAELRAEYFAIA